MPEPYFFRNHWQLPLVGNIMKVPRHSKLMAYCSERAIAEIDGSNTVWNKPIQILCDGIKKFQMQRFIHRKFGNIDYDDEIRKYFDNSDDLPTTWYFVHWLNSYLHLTRSKIKRTSALYRLLQKYELDGQL